MICEVRDVCATSVVVCISTNSFTETTAHRIQPSSTSSNYNKKPILSALQLANTSAIGFTSSVNIVKGVLYQLNYFKRLF